MCFKSVSIAAGEESYVAVDKGAITDSHVLVLPIEHFPSSLHLSASTYAEMERYLSALRSCFASQVLPPSFPNYFTFPFSGTWQHAVVCAIDGYCLIRGKVQTLVGFLGKHPLCALPVTRQHLSRHWRFCRREKALHSSK